MEDNELTTVQISKGGLQKLGKIAEANRRSKFAQLEWMVEMETRRLARIEAQRVAIPEKGRQVIAQEAEQSAGS